MYLTAERYRELTGAGDGLTDRELERLLFQAEADVDALTFCRIRVLGFEKLSGFQRELVERAVCLQADFRTQYGEMLENPLASYSINGVAMSWDDAKVKCVSGVYTRGGVLALLEQTGLTCRRLP